MDFPMQNLVFTAMKAVGKPVRPGDIAHVLGAEAKRSPRPYNPLENKEKVSPPSGTPANLHR